MAKKEKIELAPDDGNKYIYLVYSNDCYEGECECGASHMTLESAWEDPQKAQKEFEKYFQGTVTYIKVNK